VAEALERKQPARWPGQLSPITRQREFAFARARQGFVSLRPSHGNPHLRMSPASRDPGTRFALAPAKPRNRVENFPTKASRSALVAAILRR